MLEQYVDHPKPRCAGILKRDPRVVGFLGDLDRGAFTLAPVDHDLLRRAGAIDRRHASMRFDLVVQPTRRA